MKIIVSLAEPDLAFLDEYAEAFEEWAASGDAEAWDATVADGRDAG